MIPDGPSLCVQWRQPCVAPPRRAGFTLIELLVVVLIIGILAAIAVPQYFRVVEKGRFAESTSLFSAIKGSEERYLLKRNTYTGNTTDLDVAPPTTKYFGTLTVTGTAASYTVSLTRSAPTPNTYGAYVVSYVGPGGTISCGNASCAADLAP